LEILIFFLRTRHSWRQPDDRERNSYFARPSLTRLSTLTFLSYLTGVIQKDDLNKLYIYCIPWM